MGVKVREKVEGSGEWWIFINHNNRRKSQKVGRDKAAAERIAAKIEAKLTLGELGFIEGNKPTLLFETYANRWLEKYVKHSLAPGSYRTYKASLENYLLPHFGKMVLADIERKDVKDFYYKKLEEGNLNKKTLSCVLSGTLASIFAQAKEDGHMTVNPAHTLGKIINGKKKRPMDVKQIYVFTEEELQIYLETCKRHFPKRYPFCLTLARTGMRPGEAIALEWNCVDFEERLIEVRQSWGEAQLNATKTGEERQVEMTPQLTQILRELYDNRDPEAPWVFPNQEGNPLELTNFRNRVHYKIFEKAEEDGTPIKRRKLYSLRHTYATLRLMKGHNIWDVSKQMGHESIDMTYKKYSKWLPREGKRETDELDNIGTSKTHPIRTPEKEAPKLRLVKGFSA